MCQIAQLNMITLCAEVSLTIAPEHRCRGLGTSALLLLTEKAASFGVSELLARIRRNNIPSQRTFQRAGFEQSGEEDVNGVPALRYRLGLT